MNIIVGIIICRLAPKHESIYNFVGGYLDIKFDLEEYLTNPTINQMVAMKDNKLIGARMFRINDGFIHLSYTAVIPEERGKEINHQMLLEIEKIAVTKDIHIITSSARVSNNSSIRSLEKSGFILDWEKESFYNCGERKLHYFKFI